MHPVRQDTGFKMALDQQSFQECSVLLTLGCGFFWEKHQIAICNLQQLFRVMLWTTPLPVSATEFCGHLIHSHEGLIQFSKSTSTRVLQHGLFFGKIIRVGWLWHSFDGKRFHEQLGSYHPFWLCFFSLVANEPSEYETMRIDSAGML